MGTVEEVSDFCGWVEKLLSIAHMEERSWKYLSAKFGWIVKTHGKVFLYIFPFLLFLSFSNPFHLLRFPAHGVSAAAVSTSKLSLAKAQEIIVNSSS